ncbi:MAG: MATE family efflux transporter, partial [Cytophagales bacterium]
MLCQKKKTQALTTYFFLIWPIFLRILLLSLLRMVDGVLARNLENPNTLTTLELGRTFIGTPTFLFMGIANMLSGIVIEADLSRSYRKSTEALTASFFIALLLLGPWTIIFCCFSKPILLYWQQPVEVVALTSSYLAIT